MFLHRAFNCYFSAFSASQEVDIAVLQRMRSMIDTQRDQIRNRDRELSQKNSEIENVSFTEKFNYHWHVFSSVI